MLLRTLLRFEQTCHEIMGPMLPSPLGRLFRCDFEQILVLVGGAYIPQETGIVIDRLEKKLG